ncbi:cytochrome c oxidase accessory protein CcoG [Galenea microaerophila]
MSEQDKKTDYKRDAGTGSLLDEFDTTNKNLDAIGVELLEVHTQGVVHAKRIPGRFRTLKWLGASLYLSFFLAVYLRWDGHQAILFDLPNRQFHIFGLTILPQDIWVLAMILLFFALALAAVTAVAGRLWCGYLCFHTVWTDVFTYIEDRLVGGPNKLKKLDKMPFGLEKIKKKLPIWLFWLGLSFLTAITFVGYFDDIISLWKRLFTLDWTTTETTIILSLTVATFFFAGFLREQVCIGFCPYARIQGAMIDVETIVPTYDRERGEPRGRMRRPKPGEEPPKLGDCIDCNLCVAVCPTGVDIRKGQQFGCITCGLCIDACDSVMEKIHKPKGLIRYASLAELGGKAPKPLWKRPRVIVYTSIMTLAAAAMIYGLSTMSPIDVKVLHDRAPLFVKMSNGYIQNKYMVKIVNKNSQTMKAHIEVEGPKGTIAIANQGLTIESGNVGSSPLLVRVPADSLKSKNVPIKIIVTDQLHPEIKAVYESVFIGPKPR